MDKTAHSLFLSGGFSMLRMKLRFCLVLALAFFFSSPASAIEKFRQPDLISFAAGYKDFNKDEPRREAADFRLEYRWGVSLLPQITSYFKSWDPYVQFHPFVGGEVTTVGQLYGLGGLAMDILIGNHGIITWSEGVGLFYGGDAFPMGSFVEFRSQVEVGWRFTNEMRLTAAISHISNAKITNRNPGAEIVSVYFHMPTSFLCGKK
ncbi:MAG: acyloxyacyl hydrolase [Alphaproteobacteria bacterium]|nr:acyloxyacyl hydrolase [Alphaproteobacteria bacterium]